MNPVGWACPAPYGKWMDSGRLNNRKFIFGPLAAVGLLWAGSLQAAAPAPPTAQFSSFFKRNCYECHKGKDAEAGLDLSKLPRDLADPHVQQKWVHLFDRVAHGEMPPPKDDVLIPSEKKAFLQYTGDWIRSTQLHRYKTEGRVRARRWFAVRGAGALSSPARAT